MTNTLFRTVATVAMTLVASGTFLFGALAPAEAGSGAGSGLHGAPTARILA